MSRGFEEAREERADLRRGLERASKHWGDLRRWIEVNVGGLQNRAGRDITPDQVRLRQKIEDSAGKIGPAGRKYEYDILAINGQALVFVKSTPDAEDVERFADKADLVAEQLGRPELRRVLLTLVRSDEVVEACRRRGVELAS